MGEREDAENERRSRAMVDGVRPVRYWQQRPTIDQLADRLDRLEQRVAEVERRSSRRPLPPEGALPHLRAAR